MREAVKRRGGVAAALAAGLLLRWFFVRHHAEFTGDALVYGDIALNLVRHHRYELSQPVLHATLIRLPGYPAFLAACFALFGSQNYVAVLWVQVVLDLFTCLLLGKLAERIWGTRVGTAALWIAALCPFTANFAAASLTETLSIFCVVAAFFALERWSTAITQRSSGTRWAIAVGLALSYAVLLRPEQGLLAAAIIPAMLWTGWSHRQGIGRFSAATLASAIVLVPLALWGLRNWQAFHVVQPLGNRSRQRSAHGLLPLVPNLGHRVQVQL
jgi:4-amino-4-deoxy-L-arabinose transferase-like glycosyltransferase